MTPPRIFIIDSWPVPEWLQRKSPAGDLFSRYLKTEVATGTSMVFLRINWAEIVYMLPKKFRGDRLLEAQAVVQRLPCVRISVDDALKDAAAELKTLYAYPFAERFAAAPAMRFNAPVVPGDTECLKLRDDGLVSLEWLSA